LVEKEEKVKNEHLEYFGIKMLEMLNDEMRND
jgi:hypothetical protein